MKCIQRQFPFSAKAFNILGIKISSAIKTDKFPPKHFNIWVILNYCSIIFQ